MPLKPLLLKPIRRVFALALAACFPTALWSTSPEEASPEQSSPNVLFIITDDQGYGDLSLHGNEFLDTPNMDRLGREGVRMDSFYVSPVCAPTRASLFTGRYHLRTGASSVTRRKEVMDPSEVTIAELMREHGYATGCFGKWHNGSVYPETPNGQGFDEFLGFNYGVIQNYFDPELDHNGVETPYEGYITDILTDRALDWMQDQVAQSQPFFCFLSYNAPHTPVLVPERYREPFIERGLEPALAGIYGMVHSLDEQIGRVIDWVDDSGIAQDTLIIFMTDNGPNTFRYNAGLKGKKSNITDGGIRVPSFFRWTGALEPSVQTLPVSHVDLLPTLAELCGLPLADDYQSTLDGRSFVPLLRGQDQDWEDRTILTFHFGSQRALETNVAVHTNRWNAVQEQGRWSLHDRLGDPGQENDLSAHHPDVLAQFKDAFTAKLQEFDGIGETTPIPIGIPGQVQVRLEAHDASLTNKGAGIDYNYPAGFAYHWIARWTAADAFPTWSVEGFAAGEYAVSIKYCLKESDVGVQGLLRSGSNELKFTIDEAFDPTSNEQPFILADEAIKYESKPWRTLDLGSIHVDQGRQSIVMRLTHIPGSEGIELKEISLRRASPSRH